MFLFPSCLYDPELADGPLSLLAHYDRVLVMDDGELAELDTALNLYDNEASIFRSLCEEANLGRQDILKIREDFSIHT